MRNHSTSLLTMLLLGFSQSVFAATPVSALAARNLHEAEVVKKIITILQETPVRVLHADFAGIGGLNQYDGGLIGSLSLTTHDPGCYRVKALTLDGEFVLRFLNSVRYLSYIQKDMSRQEHRMALATSAQAITRDQFGIEAGEVDAGIQADFEKTKRAVEDTQIEVEALDRILAKRQLKTPEGGFNVRGQTDLLVQYQGGCW